MRALIAAADRLFPLRPQHDRKLWSGLAAIGMVDLKRGGKSYDHIHPREMASFVIGRLASDSLTDALRTAPTVAALPGEISGIPDEWTVPTLLARKQFQLWDWLEALIFEFAAGDADGARLRDVELRLTTPYPVVTIAARPGALRPTGLTGRFAAPIAWPSDDADLGSDLRAIEAVNDAFTATAISTERVISLEAIRAFAKAVASDQG